jgi:hypothetical protein
VIMPPKVNGMNERKQFYMSDLRTVGRISVTVTSVFKSVKQKDQWVVDLSWQGDQRYLVLDSDLDRESFLRLAEHTDVEIESVGRPGVSKIAIYSQGKRIDVHYEREQHGQAHRGPGSPTLGGIIAAPAKAPTTLEQLFTAYEGAYPRTLKLVEKLDPRGEQGLTAGQIIHTVLTAYALANQFSFPRPKRHPNSSSELTGDGSES